MVLKLEEKASSHHKQPVSSVSLAEKFQSHVLLTPQYPQRMTISPENYARYRQVFPKLQTYPWGRSSSYGGMGPIQLPNSNKVQKCGVHFGSGMTVTPRGLPIQQQYQLTDLRRSQVRNTDELIEDACKIDLTKHQLKSPYPQQHPYSSHLSKTRLFPTYEPVEADQKKTGKEDNLPATSVMEKAIGNPKRFEKIKIPLNSSKKIYSWNESSERPHMYKVSRGTSEALRKLKLSQWKSTYQNDFNYEECSQDKENLQPLFHPRDDVNTKMLADSETNNQLALSNKTHSAPSNKNRVDINVIQQSWSPTKMHREFHRKFTDPVPSLYRVPDRRITPQEKRHFIPEGGYIKSNVLNGNFR